MDESARKKVRAKYCHKGKTAQHHPEEIKSLPQGARPIRRQEYNILWPLKIESRLISFAARPRLRCRRVTPLELEERPQIPRKLKDLAARTIMPR
jgi:hypothetical protein